MATAAPVYLVGDLGGTHVRLGLSSVRDGRIVLHVSVRWPAREFARFDDALRRFLSAQPLPRIDIHRACLAVAGPIDGRHARLTNRAWRFDAAHLESTQVGAPVMLVNDLAAAAAGVDALDAADLVPLQVRRVAERGTRLVIGAGTGLGIALAVWQNGGHRVLPSEGGHAGFAPQTQRQWDLAEALRSKHGRIEAEHLVSGAGIERIYEVLRGKHVRAEAPLLRAALLRGEGAVAIVRFALQEGDAMAMQALDLFVECYGSVAGDHALTVLARGGVYVVGGIAARILPRLAAGGFLRAFNDKAAFRALTEALPVAVATDDRLGLFGATRIAAGLVPDDA